MGTGTRSLIQCNWRLDERGRNTIRGRKNSLTLSKPLANLLLNHPQGALNGLLALVGSRSSGFFLWTNLPPTENRVLFLMKAIDFIVDGFNLYHSARQAAWKLRIPTKWLNIHALCSSFIHIASRVLGEKTELRNIYYFSALADHLEDSHPGITRRHKAFLKCLEDTGVIVELSRFKASD